MWHTACLVIWSIVNVQYECVRTTVHHVICFRLVPGYQIKYTLQYSFIRAIYHKLVINDIWAWGKYSTFFVLSNEHFYTYILAWLARFLHRRCFFPITGFLILHTANTYTLNYMILSLPGVKQKTETSFLQWGRSKAAQRGAFQELQPASSTICHHVFFPKLPERGLQHSNLLDPSISLLCDQSCSISCSSPCNWFFWLIPSSELLRFGYVTATWPHNHSNTCSEM